MSPNGDISTRSQEIRMTSPGEEGHSETKDQPCKDMEAWKSLASLKSSWPVWRAVEDENEVVKK